MQILLSLSTLFYCTFFAVSLLSLRGSAVFQSLFSNLLFYPEHKERRVKHHFLQISVGQNQMHYGNSANIMPQRHVQSMESIVTSQLQMIPNMAQLPSSLPATNQKPKTTRRRKNAQQNHGNENQQQINSVGMQAGVTSNGFLVH